ncbi:uncharacterized protein LOC131438429 [Malaya genurostris]|uniref:uncharacterized protein LOC131438429 n=1 Tax=Malaya genurostris TaxID=325434 RepID=UPI0026F3CF6E|nr:uncharacterized protein LOC131438429 [Malaya genurostris]
MNHWLTLVCTLALLSGAHSFYASIAVGGNGLVTLANNLKAVSTIMANYYAALNAANSPIIASLNDLLGYANTTYTALNKTYGASQPGIVNLVQLVPYLNQSVSNGEQSVNQAFASDWSSLFGSLNQIVDRVMSMYSSLLSTSSYSSKADNCTSQNATQMVNVTNAIVNAAQCLQVEANQNTALVPDILGTIALLKNDLATLNNNLLNCNVASTRCVNQYFDGIYDDWMNFQSELYTLLATIQSSQQFAQQRDQACGNFALADVQDEINNLINSFSQCAFSSP